MLKVEITYRTIAKKLNTSVGAVKNMAYRGEFNPDDEDSIIIFVAMCLIRQNLQKENKKLPAGTNNQGMNKAS